MDESVVLKKSRELKEKIKERVNNDVMTFMKEKDKNFKIEEFE